MAYTFLLNQRPETGGEHFWQLKELLTNSAVGWTVEGSGDGSTGGMDGTDRLDPGGPYNDSLDTLDAWYVVQDPNGLRQYMVQVKSTAPSNTWLVYYSSDGTGFSGGGATARPTAADEQIVITDASNHLPTDNNYYADYIVGNNDEGYSFHISARSHRSTRIAASFFLDVVDFPSDSDPDPAVTGGGQDSTGDSYYGVGTGIFGEGTSRIFGWYRKGEANEAWVDYPFVRYNFEDGLGIGNDWDEETGVDANTGEAWLLPCPYIRGRHRTQAGYKGMSHLFQRTAQITGEARASDDLTRVAFGSLTIPWDGETAVVY